MARPSEKTVAKRRLAIINYLCEQPEVPVSELAELFGVTDAVIEEDVWAIACLGPDPWTLFPLSVDGGVVTVDASLPALDKPLRLSATEAHALVLALQATDIDDDPLLTNLLAAAAVGSPPPETFERILHAGAGTKSGDLLKAVAHAMETRSAVEIDYRSQGTDAASKRMVEPLQLLNDDDYWYLEAYCRRAGALRVFRVDRIKEARVSTERFVRRELELSARPLVTENMPRTKVLVKSGIDLAELRWPDMTVLERRDNGDRVVELPYAGTAWIVPQVIACLGRAEVLEPEELRRAVSREARRLCSKLEASEQAH